MGPLPNNFDCPDNFHCSGPARRRDFLRFGLAGVGAQLSLPALHRLRAESSTPSRQDRTAVIVVWLHGGASHLETYDPKPLAPSGYRGPFNPISTNVPGIDVCELLPEHAKIADKFSILRSLVHTGFCHQQGTQQVLTGHPVRELRNKPDHPDFMSIAYAQRGNTGKKIPNYIGLWPVPYAGSAYLGPGYEPLSVYGNPDDPKFEVPNLAVADEAKKTRIGQRLDLRKEFDKLHRNIDRSGNMQALDQFETQAWDVLTGTAAKKAFQLQDEPQHIRERYGRNQWGQQLLLARRLVEAGVELVTTSLVGPLCGRIGNWDDHAVNFHCFDAMKYRCQWLDRAVAALIHDLFERGLDRRVMVVVTGEFGRSPKINYAPSTGEGIASLPAGTMQPGRDHWPNATSMLIAGGGIRPGVVIGGTDRRGEEVIDRRVGVQDFLATIYSHLGIDPHGIHLQDFTGRPIPLLPEGTPIPELASIG